MICVRPIVGAACGAGAGDGPCRTWTSSGCGVSAITVAIAGKARGAGATVGGATFAGSGFAASTRAGCATAGPGAAEAVGRMPDRASGKTVDRRMLMVVNLVLRAGENKSGARYFRPVFMNVGSVLEWRMSLVSGS